MKYVKLTAKPDTWFKEGAEVFHYDERRRFTLEEWQECLEDGFVSCQGIRVCEDNPNENKFCKPGDERLDGACCMVNELEVEIVEEDFYPHESF